MAQIEDRIWRHASLGDLDRDRISQTQQVLIYIVPGNPGLIEYYRDFINDLSSILKHRAGQRPTLYAIFGKSLHGFEACSQQSDERLPLSLKQQCEAVKNDIGIAVREVNRDRNYRTLKSADPIPVILVGHSVGAYISLEVIAQIQNDQRKENDSEEASFELVGCIGLFPTIVDIARSARGRIATPIAIVPGISLMVHLAARLLCLLLPCSLLYWLVLQITKMPSQGAKSSTAFLRSKHGVRQAIYMAQYELQEIAHDKWPSSIWNSTSPPSNPSRLNSPRLYFYWGEDDHWVNNQSRDALIAARAGRAIEGEPHMEIDTQNVPHAFCIGHSRQVAEKTAGFVREIMQSRL